MLGLWRRLSSAVPEPSQCCRAQGLLVLLLLGCFLALTIFSCSDYLGAGPTAPAAGLNRDYALPGAGGEYDVWGPKCRMPELDALDPSVRSFVHHERFERCSAGAPLTRLLLLPNATLLLLLLLLEPEAAHWRNLTCCYSGISRPPVNKSLLLERHARGIEISAGSPIDEYDSRISVAECRHFTNGTELPPGFEAVLVTCRAISNAPTKRLRVRANSKSKSKPKPKMKVVYENVHPVIDLERVRDRLPPLHNASDTDGGEDREDAQPLNVLILGIDSVSRYNFVRSLPKLRRHLEERGWLELRGYNKVGDNTYPNLMALLTGYNNSWAWSKCVPRVPGGLDSCPFIWQKFREAGYVTGYGEDQYAIGSFNYNKAGFIDPPTDFYLRPYIMACEKLLKGKQRFSFKYCTGPEVNVERVYDYAVSFASRLRAAGAPFFGLFWTNGASHEDVNGPSAIDARLLEKVLRLEEAGVTEDTLILLLSDHGMRFGELRNTRLGWYEDRLPAVYLWPPPRLRRRDPPAYASLLANRHRLASPYDLYETLRDLVVRARGEAPASAGCPSCRSLLLELPVERGCAGAGVSAHWCACSEHRPLEPTEPLVTGAAEAFARMADGLVAGFRDKAGRRLCARLAVRRVARAERILEPGEPGPLRLMLLVELSPGNGAFEATIESHGPGNFSVDEAEVSRTTRYGPTAKCLDHKYKSYCHCVK